MKIFCLQENLKEGVQYVEKIVGKQVTLPILNNILIETDKGGLILSATDLELGIHVKVPGKIEKPGKISIPAKIFSNYILNLPNKKICLETKQNILEVSLEEYHATFQGQSAEEFPIIPKIKKEHFYTLPAPLLSNSLMRVVGMSAISESRPELSGVLFSFEKNILRLVATDSFRLAEKTVILSQKTNTQESFIVPQKGVLEIIHILGDGDEGGEATIAIQKNQLLLEYKNRKLISRLIEGEYPQYQSIIPKTFETEVTLAREELIRAIKINSFFTGKNNDIRFHAVPPRAVDISARGLGVGESTSKLSAKINGKEVSILFNYKFILDGLEQISDKEVVVKFNSEIAPAVIEPTAKKDYLYLVMPIKPL